MLKLTIFIDDAAQILRQWLIDVGDPRLKFFFRLSQTIGVIH